MRPHCAALMVVCCALLCGCGGSVRFTLPVEITSNPPGAEIWTVAIPKRSMVHRDYMVLQTTRGAFSGHERSATCTGTTPYRGQIGVFPGGQSATCIGTTPYRGQIDLTSTPSREWYLQGENNALSLLHCSAWYVTVPPILIEFVGAETHLQFKLKYPNGSVQDITDPVTSDGDLCVLLLPAGPCSLAGSIDAALRKLPPEGIRRHYDVGAIPAAPSPGTQTMSPPPDATPGGTKTIKERLQELKKLRDDGLITEEEYESKRKGLVEKL